MSEFRSRSKPPRIGASRSGIPTAALDAALKAADPTDRILVFGSFYTVGGVLQNGIPKLHAKHLSN